MSPDLGSIGIWSPQLRYADAAAARDAAAELEDLGFGALWFPGGVGGDVFESARRLLDATDRVSVGVGVVNVWMHPAAETRRAFAELAAASDGRFLLGLGVSHAVVVERDEPDRYRHPLSVMRGYLDELDDPPEDAVPVSARVLAALGPRMLELARDRARGAHPYLVPVAHTAMARERLGSGPLLAPEQGVLLERDAAVARARAREYLALYLEQLPNYTNNLLRCGFTAEDLEHGGSDRLVDSLVMWGDDEAIAAQVRAHLDAGADHVAVQVLGHDRDDLPRPAWRRLAAVLLG